MSDFKCEVVKIDAVDHHPNADRLSIVKIGGFDCISAKLEDGSHRYQAGDHVVYIPEAALLPEWLLQKMGFWKDGKGTLSGSKGNRVKAIRLRGVFSQGILYPVHESMTGNGQKMVANCENEIPCSYPVSLGDNVAEYLNITKYEPEIPVQMRGQLGNLFGYTKSYDIENFQKYNKVFSDDVEVVMTEKLHGTLCQIGIISDLPREQAEKSFLNNDVSPINNYGNSAVAYVTSKGLAKQGLVQKNVDSNKDNLYVKTFCRFYEPLILHKIADYMFESSKNFRLYILGEIYGAGVQDLNYGLKTQEFRVFDVYVKDLDIGTERYLSWTELVLFCQRFGLDQVKALYVGKFSKDIADSLRTGNTETGEGHIREGIVIKPTIEQDYRGLPDNRLQVKYINPDYLLRQNGTEFN